MKYHLNRQKIGNLTELLSRFGRFTSRSELLFRDDIPPIVSINEAIDLGKLFKFRIKAVYQWYIDEVKSVSKDL